MAGTRAPGEPAGPGLAASVLGHRPFRRLAEAQAAHAAGDLLVAVALADTVFFSVPLGEARAKVALYLALTMAPFAVLSPLVGPWLDRRRGSYRVAIVAAMVGRVALAIVLSSRIDAVWLYPLAFGLLVLSRVHGVSRSALVPDVIPPGRSLMWANAWLAVVSVAGGALATGPALALARWAGPDATLWVAAVVFAAGALVATGLPLGEAAGERGERPRDASALLTPRLLGAGVAMASLRAAVGFTSFLLPFLLRAHGAGGLALGLAVAAAGLGAAAASLLGPALRRVMPELVLLLVALLVVAATAFLLAGVFSPATAAVIAGVVGLTAGAGRLAFDSLIQRDAPEHVRARTFARYETIFQLCWVAAGAAATAIPFGPAAGLWTLAGICCAGIVLSVRGLRRAKARAAPSAGEHE